MPVVYSNTAKTNRMTAVRDTIDAGTGPGVLQIGTAGMATVLAEITLGDPCGTVSGSTLTLSGFPRSDTSANATGTVTGDTPEPPEPPEPPAQGGGRPWRFVASVQIPVRPRRPRRKRDEELALI